MACDGVVQLRQAQATDARPIAMVHVDSWRAAYRGLIDQRVLDGLSVDGRERLWLPYVSTSAVERRPWVAEADGLVVGFVSAGPTREEEATATMGEVYAIYIAPDCWAMGVGRMLLAHAELDLRTRGFDEAELWVLTGNDRARRFYEAAGWRFEGTEKTETFNGAELHEVRYRKRLG